MPTINYDILKQKNREPYKIAKRRKPYRKKLHPIFFTFDTLDGGKVDRHATRHYRRSSL